jgi:hypothetical protein
LKGDTPQIKKWRRNCKDFVMDFYDRGNMSRRYQRQIEFRETDLRYAVSNGSCYAGQSGKLSRVCSAMKRGLERSGSSSGSTLRKTRPLE